MEWKIGEEYEFRLRVKVVESRPRLECYECVFWCTEFCDRIPELEDCAAKTGNGVKVDFVKVSHEVVHINKE